MTGTCGRCRFPLSQDHHTLRECLAALRAAVAVWRPLGLRGPRGTPIMALTPVGHWKRSGYRRGTRGAGAA